MELKSHLAASGDYGGDGGGDGDGVRHQFLDLRTCLEKVNWLVRLCLNPSLNRWRGGLYIEEDTPKWLVGRTTDAINSSSSFVFYTMEEWYKIISCPFR